MDLARDLLFHGMGSSSSPRRLADPFALLYRAHVAFVWHVVRLAGIREADIADVVQDVFVILDCEIRRGLDMSASLRGWLKRTTFRRARDYRELAMHREQPAHDDPIDTAETGPNPEESMHAIDTRENVMAVLDKLPHDQRLVLVMHDAQEMPMSEIAEVLESPSGTCYTRLYAARKGFKRAWDERRASGLAAVVPFAMWDADSLFETAKAIPEPPPGFEEQVWHRLVNALGPGIAGAGAAAATGGALVAGATKAGVVLTAKQIAIGAVLSALSGAGLYAVVRSAFDVPQPPAAVAATNDTEKHPRQTSALTASALPLAPVASMPQVAPSATGTAIATSAPSGGAPAHDEARERLLLDAARTSIGLGDFTKAGRSLNGVKSKRFAPERDDLVRIIQAHTADAGRLPSSGLGETTKGGR